MAASSVYQHPRYYAIGYQWNTKAECDFLQACVTAHATSSAKTVLDIGCGAGRHLMELARRGYTGTGMDLRPEMVAYVNDEAKKAKLPVTALVGDVREPLLIAGTFGLGICLMDTFRYLLTNEQIVRHVQQIASHLAPGGLYITDFWIPTKWDQVGGEIYQWEQHEGETTVRVFYVQHPDSIDPISQTFEDELVFAVDDAGESKEIHGERTRTRLIMPQEFRALVQVSGMFDLLGTFAEFDREKPLSPSCTSWRMISVLQRRPK